MKFNYTESYIYDPESINEGKRLYREAITQIILKELMKRNELKNTKLEQKTTTG